jgi:hypothetical protein
MVVTGFIPSLMKPSVSDKSEGDVVRTSKRLLDPESTATECDTARYGTVIDCFARIFICSSDLRYVTPQHLLKTFKRESGSADQKYISIPKKILPMTRMPQSFAVT